jgi:putative flavoprotein involved in K+ transport
MPRPGWQPSFSSMIEQVETIIVGGGQAGLAVGYHLAQGNRPFVILDANERTGDSWRKRWDSLRLFTPAYLNGLPGLEFPGPRGSCPSKDEMADYLEAYAARRRHHTAHSSEYRTPTQLRDGDVLVVGAANSGAEIALEASTSHRTWLSGRHPGSEPTRPGSRADRIFTPPFWFFLSRVASVTNPIGRRMRPRSLKTTSPLGRVKPKDLDAAGVARLPRTIAVRDGRPVMEDGRVVDVVNVVWATGYRPAFDWVDLDVFDQEGQPVHDRGTTAEPGLYFIGLFFLSSLASSLVGGVGRDAEYIARHIAGRRSAGSGRMSGAWKAVPS